MNCNRHISTYKILFPLLLFAVAALSSCGVKARIKKADKKFSIGEYYTAGNIYQSCYKRVKVKDKPTRAYVAFQQGECYRFINNTKAPNAYKNAIRNKYPDPIVFLRQAQTLQYQAKYNDALKSYELYLQAVPNDTFAIGLKYGCQQIAEWQKQKSRYKIALAKDFNSKKYSSFAPQFIGDDADAVMFTSNRTPTSKKNIKNSRITGSPINYLYTTRKNAEGKWEEIEKIEGLLANDDSGTGSSEATQESGAEGNDNATQQDKNASVELGVCCFSQDGKTMYFTYSKPINGQDQGAKIYVSNRASGTWGEPQEVKIFPDSTITCAHPALSYTGDTLYFVSDAPGGYGGKDLWFAEFNNGDWVAPTNLGPQINTAGDEMFPTIRKNGTLYFASNGLPGYGGLDIFYAVPDSTSADTMRWTLYNMGAPFNSSADDFGITFAADSENGFFSSNRGQKRPIDQIYSFTLPEMVFIVEGAINDNNGEHIADGIIRLVGDNGTNQKVQVKKDGTYKIKLEKNVQYAMLARARGFLNQSYQLNTLDLNDTKIFTHDFSLTPISKPVTMNNIFYEFGKYTLTPQSTDGLNQLIKLLQDNPNITIELAAHTDRVGNDNANILLSERRAQSVVDYLIEHGIDKERLTAVGYGKHKPVVADKKLNQQYSFIPIEQELNEEFIDTLKPEQQEICNTLNRRTEFRVLTTTYKLY